MKPGEYPLEEGGYLSNVVAPALGELLTGLAWLAAARRLARRTRVLYMLSRMYVNLNVFKRSVHKQHAPW
jgi:hypothetical protein